MITFASLGLHASLVSTLNELNLHTPTPVQVQAIPPMLAGGDVMASAPTGTGKTAAFVLPALHRLASRPMAGPGHGPRVLVLTPTRELAQQVHDNTRTLGKLVRPKQALIVGGVSYGPQFNALRNPLDVLVATPGRLIDHVKDNKVDFRRLELLVLDEADKMLDMGFLRQVEQIMQAIGQAGAKPQVVLMTATLTKAVSTMAAKTLRNPAKITLATTPQADQRQIKQMAFRADNQEHKLQMLNAWLERPEVAQAIVFSATKHGADRLAKKLVVSGVPSAALHGGMKQGARKRTLEQLHKGAVRVVVATDVAARGLDVKALSCVVNFDLPQVAEDFVHRIGRTGRAGETGLAVSFVAPTDVPMLRDIEKLLGKAITLAHMDGHEPGVDERDFLRAGAAAPKSRKGQGRAQGGAQGQTMAARRGPPPARSHGGNAGHPRGPKRFGKPLRGR